MTFFRNIIISLIIFTITIILIYKPLTDEEIKQDIPNLFTTDRLLKESLTLRSIGLIKEAEEKLKEAITRQPQYALTHYFLAEIYNEQKLTEKAINEYKKVIDIDSEAYKSRVRLGELYYIEGNKEKSIKILIEAMKINPKDIEVHEILYSIYKKEGMNNRAEELFKKFENKNQN